MDAKLTPEAKPLRFLPRGGDGIGLGNLKPFGRYLAKDVCESRDVPLLARTLLDCGCVTGRTALENAKFKRNRDQFLVRPADQPHSATRGIVGFESSLAPADAVVKDAGMAGLKLTGPARFDGEQACREAVKNKKYREGEVLVIRYAGPQGGLGVRDILAHGVVAERACHAAI
jgi:dihydroxy-acid dehydratase